jgi:hypothetical protein
MTGSAMPASASPAAIPARAFGMHFLYTGHAYPAMTFGAARIWDMGVTWKDLEPRRNSWSTYALGRLDRIVAMFRAHRVEPMITLGWTPSWAARHCRHVYNRVNYGVKTCAPTNTTASGAWGGYVRMLASRYKGKVRYFELWNEPSLHNGYNDSIALLAKMQKTARNILHHYHARLVSPGIAFTDGGPRHGLGWLDKFLSQPGGTSFDIFGVHLYPMDAAAKAKYGPEWSIQTLGSARAVLRRHHIGGKPTWNTETNVGRVMTHITFKGGWGAAMVARTYVLATQNGIRRTMWYAADDRHWGGTWLEASDFRTLTAAGHAYVTARNMLVGARPYGCSRKTISSHGWRFTCRYHLANGKNMLAVWTTGRAFTYHGPRGTQRVTTATGATRTAHHSTALRVGAKPLYVIGTFKV